MARPRTYPQDRVVAAARIPRSMHRQLQQRAKTQKVPLNVVMTSAFELYLKETAPQETSAR